MPSKRKIADTDIEPAAVPPSLPPSVEEAYRRKCVQLKNRTNEVEDANDAARLRLARIKRQVEKLRIERAFLLEQLAKRTSTNVEDSEGSPSPPPTPDNFVTPSEPSANPRKPKDKPLRIKKGHRKSTAPGDAEAKGNAANQPPSPTSETNSHVPSSQAKGSRANGLGKSSKEPNSAFELYCEDARPAVEAQSKDDHVNINDELARGWEELPEAERDEFHAKYERLAKCREDRAADADADAYADADAESPKKGVQTEAEGDKPEPHDDDVEMGNYDTEDQMDKDGDD